MSCSTDEWYHNPPHPTPIRSVASHHVLQYWWMISHPTPPYPNLWAGKRSVCKTSSKEVADIICFAGEHPETFADRSSNAIRKNVKKSNLHKKLKTFFQKKKDFNAEQYFFKKYLQKIMQVVLNHWKVLLSKSSFSKTKYLFFCKYWFFHCICNMEIRQFSSYDF